MLRRTFSISLTVFTGCAALFLCERHGFRVFDQSMWGIESKESVILSPIEIFVLFGSIALGTVAGIVASVSVVMWLVQLFRPAHRADSN